MPEYGVTNEGFVLKRLDAILEEVHADLTDGFGFDTRRSGTSFLNTLVTTFCGQIADLWETAQDSYYSKFPSTATGLSLDNAVQYGGIRREAAKQTCYPLHCTGTDKTTVRAGTPIATPNNVNPPVRLFAASDFDISSKSFNEVVITVSALQADGLYSVSVNDRQFAYQNRENGNASDIFSALKILMENVFSPEEYEITVDDDTLRISDCRKDRENALTLSNNLTTESVTVIANFYTEDYGAITLPNGVLTRKVENVPGFYAVTNLLPPIYGRARETDVELRQSYIAKSALRSNTMIGSIVGELLTNVPDVLSAAGFENPTNVKDARGLPPHSIEIIAEGGEESDIAAAILRRKAGGIQTYGNQEVYVPDVYGEESIRIMFSRPENIEIWLRVTLYGDETKFPENYRTLVSQSIAESVAGYAPGDSLFIQPLCASLYGVMGGLSRVEILWASSENGAYSSDNIMADLRQKILLDKSRIRVIGPGETG